MISARVSLAALQKCCFRCFEPPLQSCCSRAVCRAPWSDAVADAFVHACARAPRICMSSCPWPHRVASASLTRLRRPRTTSFRASLVYIFLPCLLPACLPCCRRDVCARLRVPVSACVTACGSDGPRVDLVLTRDLACVCFSVSVSCHRFKATTRSQWRTRWQPPRICLAAPTPTTGDGYSVHCSRLCLETPDILL